MGIEFFIFSIFGAQEFSELLTVFGNLKKIGRSNSYVESLLVKTQEK